jgi:hypothetical protein
MVRVSAANSDTVMLNFFLPRQGVSLVVLEWD